MWPAWLGRGAVHVCDDIHKPRLDPLSLQTDLVLSPARVSHSPIYKSDVYRQGLFHRQEGVVRRRFRGGIHLKSPRDREIERWQGLHIGE